MFVLFEMIGMVVVVVPVVVMAAVVVLATMVLVAVLLKAIVFVTKYWCEGVCDQVFWLICD